MNEQLDLSGRSIDFQGIEDAAWAFYSKKIWEVVAFRAQRLSVDGKIRALLIGMFSDFPTQQKTAHWLGYWTRGLLSDGEIEAYLEKTGEGLLVAAIPADVPDVRELFTKERVDRFSGDEVDKS